MNSTSLYDVSLPNLLVSLVSMALCLFMFLGITGNVSVIIFLKPKRGNISNESVYNSLLFYLAEVDLITCCWYIPTLIITVVSTGDFRQMMCIQAQTVATSTASMNCVLLCMLSTERIFAVSNGRLIGKVLPRKRKRYYRIILVITGCITICCIILNLFRYQFAPQNFSCFGMQVMINYSMIL